MPSTSRWATSRSSRMGAQVPWHNQDQEEIYFIVEGDGEMCLGEERKHAHVRGRPFTSRARVSSADKRRVRLPCA